MKNKEFYKAKYENHIFNSKKYGSFKVLRYINSRKILIEFTKTGFKKYASASNIKIGDVKDLLKPVVCGIGFYGDPSIFPAIERKYISEALCKWHGMIRRCYDDTKQKTQPSYVGCIVFDDWHNFQNFAQWYVLNKPNNNINYHLDKDLLSESTKGYSPETCCLIPGEINNAIIYDAPHKNQGIVKIKNRFTVCIGVNGKRTWVGSLNSLQDAQDAYKSARVNQISILAKKHKSNIKYNVYQKLINYKFKN